MCVCLTFDTSVSASLWRLVHSFKCVSSDSRSCSNSWSCLTSSYTHTTRTLVHYTASFNPVTHIYFTPRTCTSPSFLFTACSNWWSPRISIRHSDWTKAAAVGSVCPISSLEASSARSESVRRVCVFSSRSWTSRWESWSTVKCDWAMWRNNTETVIKYVQCGYNLI